jgi:N-methylhydantoinase B
MALEHGARGAAKPWPAGDLAGAGDAAPDAGPTSAVAGASGAGLHATPNSALDPITLEVISNRLRGVVATMEHLLFHSGYSTILRESFDGSAGICDADGSTVMASGEPVHLLPYRYSARAILNAFPREAMREGESFLLADPYSGGNLHVPDHVIATPIFVDGEVLGLCICITHKTDVGGLVPGSSSAASREIFHDGLLVPPVRYATRDGVVPDIEAILKRNSRSPETVAGDTRAQVGCTRVGAERVRELCAEYGTQAIKRAFRDVQRLAEARVRRELSRWPDGEGEAEAWVDDDGVDLDTPLRLHVRAIKRGDEITIDFSGMHGQVKGPINLRPQASETGAALALFSCLDPTIPINDGARRPITFVNPEGRITNAQWPAPVNNYFGLTAVVYSTVQKALVPFNPRRAVGAAGFGCGALAFGYREQRSRRSSVQYELVISSLGATPQHDGVPYVRAMSHVTPNTPVEILETEYPVRVLRHEWVPDTAGAGQFRGGPGYRKDYLLLGDAVFTLRMGHQFKHAGWGVLGGKAPPPARAYLNPGTAREHALRPLATVEVGPGDVVRLEMPGGGGYGDPVLRDPRRVLDDVADGVVSPGAARQQYGVAICPDGLAVDEEGTARLRSGRRSSGGSGG